MFLIHNFCKFPKKSQNYLVVGTVYGNSVTEYPVKILHNNKIFKKCDIWFRRKLSNVGILPKIYNKTFGLKYYGAYFFPPKKAQKITYFLRICLFGQPWPTRYSVCENFFVLAYFWVKKDTLFQNFYFRPKFLFFTNYHG